MIYQGKDTTNDQSNHYSSSYYTFSKGNIKKEWVKPGATVIDVGINSVTKNIDGDEKTTLVGDVCFTDMAGLVAGVTPVPG